MLGKGLESLIPQKGSGNNNANNDGQNNGPVSNPQPLLPQEPEPMLLPAEEPEATQQPEQAVTPAAAPATPVMADLAAPTGSPAKFSDDDPIAPIFEAPSSKLQIQSSANKEEVSGSVFQIEVDKIEPNPDQPRRHFNEIALQDLARSIREFGFLQPMVVTKVETETPTGIDVSYQLIAGERRLLAAKLLGLRLVPAIIRNVHLEREKLELAVIENIQRENLNPIETARAFQRLQEEFRMTQREIAAKLGKSREVVANTVRLLDLPEYIQAAVQDGNLSESHARLLLSIGDASAQKKLFDDIVANRLTTRDVKERVKDIVRPRATHLFNSTSAISPELKEVQEALSAKFGAPVEIQQGANNGKITIVFYSPEELESILEKLKSGDIGSL